MHYRPTMTNTVPNDLITLDEVCELTGLTPSGWRTIRYRGRSEGVRRWRVGRRVMFSRKEILHWVDENHARLVS